MRFKRLTLAVAAVCGVTLMGSAFAGDHPLLKKLLERKADKQESSMEVPVGDENNPSGLFKIKVGTEERSYLLRSPKRVYLQEERLPLVIVLHGGGGNAFISEKMSGFTEKGAQEGFIVAYPNGSGKMGNHLLTWNAGHCCGSAMKNKAKDIEFISHLIDELIETRSVDPDRVYITGMSNGAMMTELLGVAIAPKLAAIAPVAGAMFGDEHLPDRNLNVIVFHGVKDKSVPYNGGPSGGVGKDAWDGTPVKSAMYQAKFWTYVNGCPSNELAEEKKNGYSIFSDKCNPDYKVKLYAIKDGGHSWPGGKAGHAGGDTPSPVLNATDVMWDFFKSHKRIH